MDRRRPNGSGAPARGVGSSPRGMSDCMWVAMGIRPDQKFTCTGLCPPDSNVPAGQCCKGLTLRGDDGGAGIDESGEPIARSVEELDPNRRVGSVSEQTASRLDGAGAHLSQVP